MFTLFVNKPLTLRPQQHSAQRRIAGKSRHANSQSVLTYSTTSSARISVGGILVQTEGFGSLRLMVNLNRVGCMTGDRRVLPVENSSGVAADLPISLRETVAIGDQAPSRREFAPR